MLFDQKKAAAGRLFLGALMGVLCYLLLAFLTQPGSFFGGSLTLDFTFCYNSQVPEVLGAVLGLLLWALFGAETAAATLPFGEEGRTLLVRSLIHFVLMLLTLWAWVLLNFPYEPIPSLALTFLLPFALIYLLVWLGRWVGWYAEVTAIREKLGLFPAPSPLKWKETMPYLFFALLVCNLLPPVLRLFDPADVPVLTGLLLPYLLLPVAGICSGVSLGKRHGFCPLYPVICFVCYLPTVFLVFNGSALFHCFIVSIAALAGSLAGAGYRKFKVRDRSLPDRKGVSL